MLNKFSYVRGTKIVLGMGVLLALIQYFSGRSIWLDEAKIALNILDRSYLGLLEPLHSNQVAPILFLWAERFFGDLFGINDMSLRLFPLLAYLASTFLLYKLLKLLTPSAKLWFIAATLFAFCQPMIYFASEVKQYMVDVCVMLLLLYLVLRPFQSETRKMLVLSVVGVLSIGFSNVAIIALFTVGLYGWFTTYKNEEVFWNRYLIPIGCWLFAFAAYYFKFIAGHPNRAMMMPFWEFAFMPSNPFSAAFWQWNFESYQMTFGKIMGANPKIPLLYHMYGVAYVVGVFAFAKARKFKILFLLTFPIITHLALSMLELYPYARRTAFYVQPLIAVICAKGFLVIIQGILWRLKWRSIGFAYLGPGICLLAITLYTFPKERQAFKRSYTFMQTLLAPTDVILLNGATDNAWEYYERTDYINIPNKVIYTGQHSYDFDSHNAGLDTLKGRVWLFFSHDHTDREKYHMLESDYMINYMKTKGKLLDSKRDIATGAFLFEMGK